MQLIEAGVDEFSKTDRRLGFMGKVLLRQNLEEWEREKQKINAKYGKGIRGRNTLDVELDHMDDL